MKPPYEIALDEAAKEFDDIPVKSFREFQEQNYEILKRTAEIYAMRFAEWTSITGYYYDTDAKYWYHVRTIDAVEYTTQKLLEQFNQPQP